jgi:hypothetical protein
MSNQKSFRFSKKTTNDSNEPRNLDIKKFEIILKVDVENTDDPLPSIQYKATTFNYQDTTATIFTPSKPGTAANPKKGSPAIPLTPQKKTVLTYSFTTDHPNSNINGVFNSTGILTISINLNDSFYPISSIFWGKDYNNFTCNSGDVEKRFKISDNTKLPFVIDDKDNVMKVNFPMSYKAGEIGVSSFDKIINCPTRNSFVFGKIVVLYTTETDDSEKIVSGTKELFTHNNKYIGIC